MQCQATDAQADDVVKVLKTELGIVSMHQFHGWFSNNSLKDWFNEQDLWKKNAPLFVAMNTALKAAEAAEKKARGTGGRHGEWRRDQTHRPRSKQVPS